MILKFFDLKEKNIKENRYFLLYGNNKGLIEEIIEKKIKPQITNNVYRYDENEIIKVDTRDKTYVGRAKS